MAKSRLDSISLKIARGVIAPITNKTCISLAVVEEKSTTLWLLSFVNDANCQKNQFKMP